MFWLVRKGDFTQCKNFFEYTIVLDTGNNQ